MINPSQPFYVAFDQISVTKGICGLAFRSKLIYHLYYFILLESTRQQYEQRDETSFV